MGSPGQSGGGGKRQESVSWREAETPREAGQAVKSPRAGGDLKTELLYSVYTEAVCMIVK